MKIVKPNAQRECGRYINYTSCHHVYKHLYIDTIYTGITVFIARAAAQSEGTSILVIPVKLSRKRRCPLSDHNDLTAPNGHTTNKLEEIVMEMRQKGGGMWGRERANGTLD